MKSSPLFFSIHYKPSSVLHLAAEPLSFIYYGDHSPSLATYPPTLDEQPLIVGIHGLATHEVYGRGVLLPSRWALTPPSHPYHPKVAVIFFYTTILSRVSSR